MNEQLYKDLYHYLETLTLPKYDDELRKTQLKNQSKQYFIQQHQLFRRRKNGQPQRVILPDQTELILFNLHKDQTGAYLEIESTYEKLKERYYWPQMYESVRHYIKIVIIAKEEESLKEERNSNLFMSDNLFTE